MLSLSPEKTALIIIDLQHGIVTGERQPYSSETIIARNKAQADRFRAAGAKVVWVRVGWNATLSDYPPGNTDEVLPYVTKGSLPENWSALVDGLAQPGDWHILKHHWGAFTGTELDLQLRRHGINTLVFGGIATNFGVESSVRMGWELGYHCVVAEDLCSTFSTEMHQFSFEKIFLRIARTVQANEIELA